MQTQSAIDATVSANVRAEAARHQLTQLDLAQVLGISRAGVSARISGHSAWQLRELPPLALALDVSISELLGGDQ